MLQDIAYDRYLAKQIVTQFQAISIAPLNIVGLTPVQLIEILVPLSVEVTRLIGGVSIVLTQNSEVEAESPLVLPQGIRGFKGASPLFEISATPLALAAVWGPEEEARWELVKEPIRGRREEGHERSGASDLPPPGFNSSAKSSVKRPKRGEPPAEWSIKHPSVSFPFMLSKLDSDSLPPRPFQSTPNLHNIPPKLRWR